MTQAKVQRVGAVSDFKAALRIFEQDARAALVAVEMEIGRALDWLTNEQVKHWQREVRRRGDALTQAKNDLHRCRSVSLPGGGTPSCLEEKKALERAKLRLLEAEDKVRAVRHWGVVVKQEITEYHGRSRQLDHLLDAELPQAVATLERIIGILESYLDTGPATPPAGGPASFDSGATTTVAMPAAPALQDSTDDQTTVPRAQDHPQAAAHSEA